jgi:hypothetical protein
MLAPMLGIDVRSPEADEIRQQLINNTGLHSITASSTQRHADSVR